MSLGCVHPCVAYLSPLLCDSFPIFLVFLVDTCLSLFAQVIEVLSVQGVRAFYLEDTVGHPADSLGYRINVTTLVEKEITEIELIEDTLIYSSRGVDFTMQADFPQ